MRRFSRSRLACFAGSATAVVLALTGCGGGSDGKASDHIKTGDGSDSAASASPSASADHPSGGRADKWHPKVTVPKGVTLHFTPTSTGDAAKDAVLKGNEMFLKSAEQAFGDYNVKSGPYLRYSTGYASRWVQEIVKQEKNDSRGPAVPTGHGRYYSRQVTFGDRDGTANVTECFDQSKYYGKDKASGKVYKTQPSAADYQYFQIAMEKGPRGIWAASSVQQTEKAVKQCGR